MATGRGGRGAALLEALANNLSNRPGLKEEEPQSKQFSSGASLGRGSLLAAALKHTGETKPSLLSEPAQSTLSTPSIESKPLGRGFAAMKALLQHQQQSPMVGRGMGVSAQTSSTSLYHPTSSQASPALTAPSLANQNNSGSQDIDEISRRLGQVDVQEQPRRKERERLPTVTMIGTEGTPLDLSANYVRVKCTNPGVYLYSVQFSPPIDNRKLMMKLLMEHKDKFPTLNSFDGNIFYLPYKLPQEEVNLTSTRKTDGSKISIKLSYVKMVPPEHCCHLYNVIFRRIMYILQMCQVGKYYYNPNTPAVVPQHKLEVWPGYITAIKEHEGGLLLLLDASHRVLRTETVHDIMEKSYHLNPSNYKSDVFKMVVGCVVLTRYNNKTYRVDDILWDSSPMERFQLKTGESMTFEEYYRKQHNIVIKNPSQPLLLSKRKPPKGMPPGFKMDPEFLCLVPELCYMSGLTDDIRSQFTVMKDLAAHTRVTPAQRQFAMKKFVNNVNSNPDAKKELAIWGLELDSSTVSINGRLLPMEKIIMGNKEFMAGPQCDWSRDVCRNELVSAVSLMNWGVFYIRKDAPRVNDFIRCLQNEAKNMGINCLVPFRKELVNEKIETLVQELRNSINSKVQLVVVVNPTNREDRYSAIKKVCCVEAPVPSQVIISKTIAKPDKLRSVVQKIALQINCKLGGELWSVPIPLQKLMVVGIDTYHCPTKKKASIGGFVASMNHTCTRWYSKVCIQQPGQELVQGLQICLTAALRKFHAENHFLPEKIVIFRDGVGDGQLDVLADHEVKQLHRCFTSFGEYTPFCTTVCVQKRINTRIYSRERNGEMANPPPGTVVDHTVTRRDRYDYFIVSQHVRHGTVSPTHYIVVDDGIGLKPGQMQRLTYKMTYLYYNWPGTVRVPAPCQYAHKLAYLVGESIGREPAECLSDRLFFL
ncbi:piwi [Biomphalaria glabrata]|nr:piwi-like piwi-like protein 1 Cellular defense [Biomphalaria glabrata]